MRNITIEEFKEIRRTKENALRDIIDGILYDLYNRLGISPSSIDVSLVDITSINDEGRRMMCGGVRLNFNF